MTDIAALHALKPVEHLKMAEMPQDKNLDSARQFEGMLMANLFQTMRKTVEESNLLENGQGARQTYEYLLDQAVVAQAMQSEKGWGLAERLAEGWNKDLKKSSMHGDLMK